MVCLKINAEVPQYCENLVFSKHDILLSECVVAVLCLK